MERLGVKLAVLGTVVLAVYVLTLNTGRDEETPAPPASKAVDAERVEPARLRGDGGAPPERPAGGRVVRGHVLDQDGRAAPDIRVELERADSGRRPRHLDTSHGVDRPAAKLLASARSDANGAFAFEGLPSGADVRFVVKAVPEPPAIGSAMRLPEGDWQTTVASLRIASGTRLALRVVHADGRGARARIHARAFTAFGRPRATSASWSFDPAWTSPDGRLVLPAVPEGLLHFAIFVPARIEVRGVRVPTPFDGEYVIQLPGAGACRLEGRVTNAADQAVAAARIVATVVFPPGSDLREVSLAGSTNAEGRYVVDGLPSGRLVHLRAEAGGYLTRSLNGLDWTLDPEKPLAFDVSLTRGGTITGRVLDPEGKGIPGAKVARVEGHRPVQVAVCDGEGRYRLDGIPTGDHVIAASADGYYAEAAWTGFSDSRRDRRLRWSRGGVLVLLAEDGGTARHEFTLQPGVPVAGIVLDEEGSPVVGARVTVGARASSTDLSWQNTGFRVVSIANGTTTTGADGRFAFAGLRPSTQPVFIEARKAGLVTDALQIVVGENDAEALRTIELRAYATATLAGTVLDADDEPVGGALVWLPPSTNVRADGAGRFRITGLRAGIYSVRVNARVQGPEVTRTVSRGEVVDDLVLRAPPLFSVQGTLVDENGAPLAYTTIWVESVGQARHRTRTVTDADGAFFVEGMPDGTYRVHTHGGATTTTVRAGATGVRLVRPRAARLTTHVLHGQVLAPDGSPVSAASVHFAHASDRRPDTVTSRTASVLSGRFRLEIRTHATSVTLSVSGALDALGRPIICESIRLEDLPIGGSPFLIQLRGPGHLAGRVVDEAGVGLEGVTVMVRHGPKRGRVEESRSEVLRRTQADGSFRFDELDHGPVRLTVRAPTGYYQVDPLSAHTGDEDLVIRLEQGAVISGRVVGEDGEPLADVPIEAMPATHPNGHWGHAKTGKDGSFVLEGLDRNTTYTVRTGRDRDGAYSTLLPCLVSDVPPGATDVRVVARFGVFVEGVVVFPDGTPAKRGSVRARPVDESSGAEDTGHAFLDSPEGRFRLGPIPRGRYRIVAHPPSAGFGPSEPIEVDAPAEALRLVLTGQKTRRGQVLAEGLKGFQVAAVVHREEHEPHLLFRNQVAEDGSFVMAFQDEKSFTIVVYGHDDDRYAIVHDVTSTGDVLQVPLVEGLSIEGRLGAVSESGHRMALVYAQSLLYGFRTMARVDEEGAFRIRGLPPGDYALTVFTGPVQGEPKRTTVAAGASGVVLELPPGTR